MIKRRLAFNVGASLFAQAVTILTQLISVPLFLSFWPKERYGTWLLLSTIPAYLSLGEAGFTSTAGNEVSMAVAENNPKRALRSLHTAWGFILGISVILFFLTILGFIVFPWFRWLNFAGVERDEVRWVISLLCIYTILGILSAIFIAIYRAAYKNARNGMVQTSGRLAELAGISFALIFMKSMTSVAMAMLIMRAITVLVLFVDSRVFSPDLHLGLDAFSLAELKRTWRPSLMFMMNTLGSAIYIQGLTLLVGYGLGVAAVVVFNTTRTLTRVIVQFVTVIKSCILPEFSYLFGSGDMNRARRLNELSFEVSWCASLVLAVLIFFTAPLIMPVWTHGTVHIDALLLGIFLTSAVLNGIWLSTSGLLMGTNNHEGLTMRYLIAAGLAFILGMISIRSLGMNGIALAMIVCELMMIPYAISRTCCLLQEPVKEFLIESMQMRAIRQVSFEYYRRWIIKSR